MGSAACSPFSSIAHVPEHFFTSNSFPPEEWVAIQKVTLRALRTYGLTGSFTYSEHAAKVIARAGVLKPKMPCYMYDFNRVSGWYVQASRAATDLCLRLGDMTPPGALRFVSSREVMDQCLRQAVVAARRALASSASSASSHHHHVCNVHCPLRRLSWLLADSCKEEYSMHCTAGLLDPSNVYYVHGQEVSAAAVSWTLLATWLVDADEQDPHAAAREHIVSSIPVVLRLGWNMPTKEDVTLLLKVAQRGLVTALPFYCSMTSEVSGEDLIAVCHVALSDTAWAHAHGLRGVRGLTASDPLYMYRNYPGAAFKNWMQKLRVPTLLRLWKSTTPTAVERDLVIEAVFRLYFAGPGNDDLVYVLFDWVCFGAEAWKNRFAEAVLAKYAAFNHIGGSLKHVLSWAKEVVGDCPPYTTRWSALRAAWCGTCARSTLKSWAPCFTFVRCEDEECCPSDSLVHFPVFP